MGDQRRWAARYQFLDELWRGRDRIVCDAELEAALLGPGASAAAPAGRGEGPIASLLDALVPGEGARERAWVALRNDRRAASLARQRSGTVFLSHADASEVASDERWQIALVHLGGGPAATRAELVGSLESFLEVLGERLEDDRERTVVLSLACGDDEDRSYELLSELVEELFGDGRIYGICQPGMAAFYDFGPVLEPEPEGDDGDGDDAPAGDIEVDNSLGAEQPRFEAFLAIVGAGIPGEGVTFVELPEPEPAAVGGASGGEDELAAARVQLAEAQRRGDLQAIERQTLLEQLEQAEDQIASLEEQLDDAAARASAGDPLAGPSLAAGGGAGAAARVDALLAREQALRWELDRAHGELERLEARPIEAVEAELARLEATLARTQAALAEAEARLAARLAASGDGDEGDEASAEALAELALLLDDDDEPSPAQLRAWSQARVDLERLLHKLERGRELSALELHRQLVALKRLLSV